MTQKLITLDTDELIEKLAVDLEKILVKEKIDTPLIVGICTGGAWIAQRLHERFSCTEPLGKLNINFYRDDFHRVGLHPRVESSTLPVSIDGRHIILVDDVLYTGRTIRAALNEIFDYGRPASVKLAILLDRNERELPIGADVVAQTVTLTAQQNIKLQGPDPLQIEIV